METNTEVKELSLIEVAANNYANQKGGREFGTVYRSFLKGSEYRQSEINKLKADNELLKNVLFLLINEDAKGMNSPLFSMEFLFGHKYQRPILEEKMKISVDVILNCSPDKISLQLTEEGSIFYTFLKDDSTVYFQHYLIDEYDDSDEAIISIFKDDENIVNFAGSLLDAFTILNKALFSESSLIPEV